MTPNLNTTLNSPAPFQRVDHVLDTFLDSNHEEEHEEDGIPGADGGKEEKETIKDDQKRVSRKEEVEREMCGANQ